MAGDTKSLWVCVRGRRALRYNIPEDAVVYDLIEKAYDKEKVDVPMSKVHPFDGDDAVCDAMTVKDLLESGCGSTQNPLLLREKGMLSQYSS